MSIIAVFTTQQVARLAGVSEHRLRYWEQTGVFAPRYIAERPHRPFRRFYTFRDLVSVRTLALLRDKHHVPLDRLHEAGCYLSRYAEAPWAALKFRVQGDDIALRDPGSGEWIAIHPLGQTFLEINYDDVRQETEASARRLLRERDASDVGRITRNRNVMGNDWLVAGTRIPTSAIREFAEAGYSTEQILNEYPRLTREDVLAALAHERALHEAAA